jgi:uncharacterized YkwD family protein
MNKRVITILMIAILVVTVFVPSAFAYNGRYSAFHIANNLYGSGRYYDIYSYQKKAYNSNYNTEKDNVNNEQTAQSAENSGMGGNAAQVKQPSPDAASTEKAKPSGENLSGLTAQEREMIQYINEERVKAGLKPLTVDTELSRGARMKSRDMVDNGYFAHNSPTYGSPFEMMNSLGIQYRAAAENIARNGSVLKAHVSLMNSEGHRRNILDPNFTHVGVGIVENKSVGGITVTQWFIAK